MALKQRDDSLKYIRIKGGKIYVGKDLETPYDELEGTIKKLYYKDEEYEGTPQRKLILQITDGDETYQLSLNVESGNYSTLVSFLPNVDVSKPLTLHPRSEASVREGKEVTRNSVLVSQNGTFAKSFFTKDDNHGLPAWEIAMVGKKKVTDKSAYLEFLEDFVVSNIGSKIESDPLTHVKEEAVETAKENPKVAVAAGEKLPWD